MDAGGARERVCCLFRCSTNPSDGLGLGDEGNDPKPARSQRHVVRSLSASPRRDCDTRAWKAPSPGSRTRRPRRSSALRPIGIRSLPSQLLHDRRLGEGRAPTVDEICSQAIFASTLSKCAMSLRLLNMATLARIWVSFSRRVTLMLSSRRTRLTCSGSRPCMKLMIAEGLLGGVNISYPSLATPSRSSRARATPCCSMRARPT